MESFKTVIQKQIQSIAEILGLLPRLPGENHLVVRCDLQLGHHSSPLIQISAGSLLIGESMRPFSFSVK